MTRLSNRFRRNRLFAMTDFYINIRRRRRVLVRALVRSLGFAQRV